MKRKVTIPPKPTKEEEIKLHRFFYLPGWQFEALIGEKSTIISSEIIAWKKGEAVCAVVYGLRAVKKDIGKECIANFFVHYGDLVFQFSYMDQVIRHIELLKKEIAYEEYEEKEWRKKDNERKKRKRAKLKVMKSSAAKVA